MYKGKVVEVFKVSWGIVVVIDFLKPTFIKLGDSLKSSNGDIWKITGIAKSKLTYNKQYDHLISSVYVWDCTIETVKHFQLPIVGEELVLMKDN